MSLQGLWLGPLSDGHQGSSPVHTMEICLILLCDWSHRGGLSQDNSPIEFSAPAKGLP